MSLKERTINVDIMTKGYTKIKYKQGDSNQILNFKFYKNGSELDLTGYVAGIFYEKPNKEVLEKTGTISANTITTTITSGVLNTAGVVKTEIFLTKSEEVSISFTILIEVETSIDKNGAVQEKEEWDVIKDLLITGNNISMIDDSLTATSKTWSSDKINSQIKDITSDILLLKPKHTMWYINNIDSLPINSKVFTCRFYNNVYTDFQRFVAVYDVLQVSDTDTWSVFTNSNGESFKINQKGELAQNKELTTSDKKLRINITDHIIPDFLGAGTNSSIDDSTLIIQTCLNNFDSTLLLARKYLVTNIVVPQGKELIGVSYRKSILYSESSGYIVSTNIGEQMACISNLSIISNKFSDGVLFNNDTTTWNNGKHMINNILIKNCKHGLRIESKLTGCKINRLTILNCSYGVDIYGTDTYIVDSSIGVCDGHGLHVQANSYINTLKVWCCNNLEEDYAVIINSKASNIMGLSTQQNYKNATIINGDYNVIVMNSDSDGWCNSSGSDVYGVYLNGSYNNITLASRTGLWQCFQKSPIYISPSAFLNHVSITSGEVPNREESYNGYYYENFDCVLGLQDSHNMVDVNCIKYADVNNITPETFDLTKKVNDGGNKGSITIDDTKRKITATLDDFNSLANGSKTTCYFDIPTFKTLINTTSKRYMILKYKVRSNSRKIKPYIALRRSGSIYTDAMITNNITEWVSRQYVWAYFIYDLTTIKNNIDDCTFVMSCTKENNFTGNTGETPENGKVEFSNINIYFTDGEVEYN